VAAAPATVTNPAAPAVNTQAAATATTATTIAATFRTLPQPEDFFFKVNVYL
jgi:hypothetical protein